MWIICGLLWCIYQLFGLSFWRHPFTAGDPLVSDVMLKSVPIKKQTHLHLGYPNFKFLNYSFNSETTTVRSEFVRFFTNSPFMGVGIMNAFLAINRTCLFLTFKESSVSLLFPQGRGAGFLPLSSVSTLTISITCLSGCTVFGCVQMPNADGSVLGTETVTDWRSV